MWYGISESPEGSSSLRMKYLLESDTGSTATPGWTSTGHIAKSSPERYELHSNYQISLPWGLKG